MSIYLVQHGKAVDKSIDPDRPLSDAGHADGLRIAEFIAGRFTVDRVVHSGKTRARQTAELLSTAISNVRPEAINGIAPNDPVDDFPLRLGSSADDIMVVGHLPFLARLATLMTGSDPQMPVVNFQPGTIVCLTRVEAGSDSWQISWMVTPALLTREQAVP